MQVAESPFVKVNQVLAEVSNPADELRIIAKDEKRLDKRDREALVRAADELESTQRQNAILISQINERNGQIWQNAMTIDELQKQLAKLNVFPEIKAQIVIFNWGARP